ncbi:MAG TPA: HlyD family secretion protein [Geminicoccus sp.]|uniref:HlyD family secretion protein n=1 Tax=Geminicoccus sp. TaxID=2024832 RepID=UPI002BB54D4B|nr:HlyD family secretion protein [Geminicoccus sp.]HWL71502.1 HlyD family secretion protein [Geminicoccus sp.]
MAGVKKLVLGSLAAAAIAGGGWAGWQYWHEWRFVESTDNAYVQADTAPIAPKVAGLVQEVRVVDDQRVHAGDLLFRIDPVDYAAAEAAATAAVEAQTARIATIGTQIELQRVVIDRAHAGIEAARAQLELARSESERSTKLAEQKWTSRETLERATSEATRAAAMLRQAEADLASAEGQLDVLQAQRTEAHAALHEAEARLAAARADLAATEVRAPVDGVVGGKSVQVGQYLRAGSQAMLVVPLPDVHIVANFKETQIGRMRIGQTVRLAVDAWPDREIEGVISSLAPASGAEFSLLPAENATGNFTKIVQRVPVRIDLEQGNALAGLLRPGLSVEVSVDTRGEADGAQLAEGVFGAARPAGLAGGSLADRL